MSQVPSWLGPGSVLYTVVTGGPVHSLRVAAAAASINSAPAKQWFAAANKHLAVTPLLLPLQKN